MTSDAQPLPSLQAAHELLKQFDCLTDAKTKAAIAPRASIQQALQEVARHSDYQILGICADTFTQGYAALQAYATALGYSLPAPPSPIEGSIYLKFNPRSGLCYVDSYNGEHRGVLVSCQSAYESGINEMYGHLPLNLFE